MKINGFSSLATGPSPALMIEELNLKEGQKIIGKVISISSTEALLEIAGRSVRAKIEGESRLKLGAVLKFQVTQDPQGRIILRILPDTRGADDSVAANTYREHAIEPNLQKALVMALSKQGSPVSQLNVEKLWQLFQGFLSKYQQPAPPEVLIFIASQKWPVNPETIMTAWLFQDQEVRDLLWNILRQTKSEQNEMPVWARLIMGMSLKPEEIQAKLQILLKHLQNTANAGESGLLGYHLIPDKSSDFPVRPSISGGEYLPDSPLNQKIPDKDHALVIAPKNCSVDGPALPQPQAHTELKKVLSRLAETFDDNALHEKIEVLLDRNLALNKKILQENSVTGNYNLIPLLVNDSQNMLHEVLIKWREESSEQDDGGIEQVLQMNIPTENLGEIGLLLRIGRMQAQITFWVRDDMVRRYLLQNLNELRETINKKKNFNIKIAIEENQNSVPSLSGVDLWM